MWKRSYYTVKFYPDGKHVKVQVYLCEVLVIRFHPLVDKYWYWFLGSSEDVALGQGAAQTADPARHYLRTQPLRNCSFRVWQVPIRVGSDLKTAPKLIGWKKKKKDYGFDSRAALAAWLALEQSNLIPWNSPAKFSVLNHEVFAHSPLNKVTN